MSTPGSVTKTPASLGSLHLALAACLMVMTSCTGDTGTVIVVTVDAASDVDPAELLEINGDNGGQTFKSFFDIDGERFPLDFTITPTGRTGDIQITACTLISDGNTLLIRATAEETVTIQPDAETEIQLTLTAATSSPVCNQTIGGT